MTKQATMPYKFQQSVNKTVISHRLHIRLHERHSDGSNAYFPIYDYMQKKPNAPPPYRYYEKVLHEKFGLKPEKDQFKNQLIWNADIYPTTGPQKSIRHYCFSDLLKYSFERVNKHNCENAKEVIRRYYQGIKTYPHASFKIATALLSGFEDTACTNELAEVQTFFAKGRESMKNYVEYLKG